MKNGIIINGKQFELQYIHENGMLCDYCDLMSECQSYSSAVNLCEILHDSDAGQVYRYIGKEEEK